jgi:hypothetical protein
MWEREEWVSSNASPTRRAKRAEFKSALLLNRVLERSCERCDPRSSTMGRVTPADGRPNSSAGASPAAHEPPGRLNPAGFGAADCASLAQPALHHKRMVVCPIPDHERKTKAGNCRGRIIGLRAIAGGAGNRGVNAALTRHSQNYSPAPMR